MPRFVVLAHDWPVEHWDLMLEKEASLRAWRILAEPRPQSAIPAEPLPDHRPMYLTYEGPVSGNRGTVKRWDYGTFEPLEVSNERVRVRLRGERLQGVAVLQTTGSAPSWTFHFQPDSESSSA
ncbi:MAG: DNA polymerase ligase N-terminal domain-containing protein [Planctomycetaceae bacterium]